MLTPKKWYLEESWILYNYKKLRVYSPTHYPMYQKVWTNFYVDKNPTSLPISSWVPLTTKNLVRNLYDPIRDNWECSNQKSGFPLSFITKYTRCKTQLKGRWDILMISSWDWNNTSLARRGNYTQRGRKSQKWNIYVSNDTF